jgi:hypothetical protein
LISPRPCPTLFGNFRTATWLIDGDEDRPSGTLLADCTVFYKERTTKTRRFYEERREIHDRPTLGCVKHVYGAAFSGYLKSSAPKEAALINVLIREAEKCRFKPSKTVTARRRQLRRSAEEIVRLLQQLLDPEVDKYLRRISEVLLDPKTKLSWNMWTNNCQKLVDRLLRGKDFEYVFPRLPKDFGIRTDYETDGDFPWPRYLISFGDRIEGVDLSPYQPNSVVRRFCQSKRIECDLIEFLELAMLKSQNVQRKSNARFLESFTEMVLVTPKPGEEASQKLLSMHFGSCLGIRCQSYSII